jgi:thymidylate synthase
MAQLADLRPGIFAHTLIDAHVYTAKGDGSMAEYDHIPGLRTQLERTPRALPRLAIDPALKELSDLDPLLGADTDTLMSHFTLHGYDPHPPIRFKVAV